MLAEDRHSVAVEADRAGPAALGGAFDSLAVYDGSGTAKGDLSTLRGLGFTSRRRVGDDAGNV